MKYSSKVVIVLMMATIVHAQSVPDLTPPPSSTNSTSTNAVNLSAPVTTPYPLVTINFSWNNPNIDPSIQAQCQTVIMCSTDMVNWSQILSCPYVTSCVTNVVITNQPQMFFRIKNVAL